MFVRISIIVNSLFIAFEYGFRSFGVGKLEMVIINYFVNSMVLFVIRLRLAPKPDNKRFMKYSSFSDVRSDVKKNIDELWDICKDSRNNYCVCGGRAVEEDQNQSQDPKENQNEKSIKYEKWVS